MRAQIAASLFAVFVLSTLTSCTTNQTAILPPAVPAVEAHVISSNAVVRRTMASTTDESLLDAEFQQILSSEDSEAATKQHIDRVARLFYRTQGLLGDYDAKIDELSKQENSPATSLQTDETYARLLSAWMMRDEALAKARYFYARALEVETQHESDSKMAHEMQTHAAVVGKAFRDGLLSANNSTNRLAKQDLIAELAEVNGEFHDYQMSHDQQSAEILKRTDAFTAVLQKQIIEDPDEMQKFYEQNAAQLRRETEAARGDAELNAEMEKLLPEVKKHLSEQFEQRTPQSAARYTPGLNRTGMLNGCEFPKGVWALTFDDGPHPTYTLQELANLKASGLKGTFFWLAQHVSHLKSIVENVKGSGMTLGNHSFTHPQLPKLGPSGLSHEIDESTGVDVATYGFKPKFFRCPYGACGSQTSVVRQKIADEDMISVTWNVDSLDWQDKNPATVYARVKKQMAVQKHGIILFHDIHPQSVTASKRVMADLAVGQKTNEYRVVTIEQALNELNTADGVTK